MVFFHTFFHRENKWNDEKFTSAKYTEKSADYAIEYYICYFSDIMFAKSTRNRSI